jgi:Ca2+/Na+ antiporter
VAIVVLVVMVIARHVLQLALRRSSGDAASERTFASASSAVVLGAVMVVIPLAVQLAETYGVLNDPDSGKRTVMIIIGLYLAATGNSLPRLLPPVSAMQGNAARAQAFQRLLGWTWVVFGLGFAIAWLVLPIDAAGPVSVALVAAAFIVTMVQLIRLRKPRQDAPGLS